MALRKLSNKERELIKEIKKAQKDPEFMRELDRFIKATLNKS